MARIGCFREVLKFETVWPGDLPWWCLYLKQWSVRGGNVSMTKCVILASGMVASNSRLERQRNDPKKAWNVYPMAHKSMETS
jgi:hypothetical protein